VATLSEILRRRSPLTNCLAPEATVAAAVRVMSEREVGAVLIEERGNLVGIFSERDLLRRVIARGRPPEATALHEVMTRDPITAAPGDDRASAIRKMYGAGCRHLPIAVAGRVIDTVSIRDLLFAELEERDGEIEQLKRYIQGA
jgi:CBS domain-containing protein